MKFKSGILFFVNMCFSFGMIYLFSANYEYMVGIGMHYSMSDETKNMLLFFFLVPIVPLPWIYSFLLSRLYKRKKNIAIVISLGIGLAGLIFSFYYNSHLYFARYTLPLKMGVEIQKLNMIHNFDKTICYVEFSENENCAQIIDFAENSNFEKKEDIYNLAYFIHKLSFTKGKDKELEFYNDRNKRNVWLCMAKNDNYFIYIETNSI